MTTKKLNLADFDLLIFDLDGVIYKGTEPIDHVVESMDRFYKLDKKIAFLTNNSTITSEAYVIKLCSMNIRCTIDQVFTSSNISANALSSEFDNKSNAFVIGEGGLQTALKEHKFSLLNTTFSLKKIIEDENICCDFVIAGLDRNLTYTKLAAASLLINRGAKFYATNIDPTLPDIYGLLPGSGAIVKAISTATAKKPLRIFGKPSPEGILQIIKKYKVPREKTIMIGDQIETDILCAKNAGINSLLVLTGATSKSNMPKIPKSMYPDFIINNLNELA